MIATTMYQSESSEWETPRAFFEKLHAEHGFTLDVAASAGNAKCAKFFTVESNGLLQSWAGEVCWMNPPYGRQVRKWIAKAHAERSHAKVVALLPARTDTRYFHEFIEGQAGVSYRFLKGRLKFCKDGEPVINSAPFPSMLVVFDARDQVLDAKASEGEHVNRHGLATTDG